MGAPLRGGAIACSGADRALALAQRLAPRLAALLVGVPVMAGLAFTALPAFGRLPALGGTAFSLDPFRALAAQPGIWRSALLSLGTGLAASFLALTLAMLTLAAFGQAAAFRRLSAALPPLLALPHAAAAFALAFLAAPSGWLFRLAAPLAGWDRPPDLLLVNDPLGVTLTLGLALKETPFLLLVALAALPQAEAGPRGRIAASLGYGSIAGFLLTVWPALYRQIRLPVLAVVAFSTSVVDMAAILGPTLPPVLAQRIVLWMNDPDLSRRFLACAGALMQLGVSLVALGIWAGFERLFAALREALARRGRRFARDRVLRGGVAVLAATGLAALCAGMLGLALWSFAGPWPFPRPWPQTVSSHTWRDLAPGLAGPLADTLLIGATSAGAALLLCVLWLGGRGAPTLVTPLVRLPPPSPRGQKSAPVPAFADHEIRREVESRAADALLASGKRSRQPDEGAGGTVRPGSAPGIRILYLPLLLPQPAFLFGLQLLFLSAGLPPGRAAVVLAHLVFVLPYVFLALAGPWEAFDRRYEQVAASLGHGPARVLLAVRLPMLMPALLGAAAVGFAVSAGLYLPTLLVGAGRVATVTTEAVALASGAERRAIGVVALVQALLPWAGFAIALGLPALLRRRRLRAHA